MPLQAFSPHHPEHQRCIGGIRASVVEEFTHGEGAQVSEAARFDRPRDVVSGEDRGR